jgi:hypothetical protein
MPRLVRRIGGTLSRPGSEYRAPSSLDTTPCRVSEATFIHPPDKYCDGFGMRIGTPDMAAQNRAARIASGDTARFPESHSDIVERSTPSIRANWAEDAPERVMHSLSVFSPFVSSRSTIKLAPILLTWSSGCLVAFLFRGCFIVGNSLK